MPFKVLIAVHLLAGSVANGALLAADGAVRGLLVEGKEQCGQNMALVQTFSNIVTRESTHNAQLRAGRVHEASSVPSPRAVTETGSNLSQLFLPTLAIIAACGLVWYVCCLRSSWPFGARATAEDAAEDARGQQGEDSKRSLGAQVSALTWKNTRVNVRTPCCVVFNTCCWQIFAPIVYIGLLTVLPDTIIRVKHLLPELVTDHPMEYGRNYSNREVWDSRGRELEDYLFAEPRMSSAAVPGYAQLWAPYFNVPPAGACYCRTLGIVGPHAEELRTYFEDRYSTWRRKQIGIYGLFNFNPVDRALMEKACPANDKATFFRIFENEQELDEWTQVFEYGSINRTRNPQDDADRLCGAVVFENDPLSDSVPRFVVRTNITGMGVGGQLERKRVNTEQVGIQQQSAALFWYLRSGFLSIQELTEDFLLVTRLGTDEHLRSVDFVPLPSEPYRMNRFRTALAGPLQTPTVASIMFASNIMFITSFMIKERNARQKELMRLMGLFDSSFALSWLALFFMTNLMAVTGCSLMVYSIVVEQSDFFILLVINFFCAMSTTAMGMVVSTLISTERLGALVAFGLYYILGLAYLALTVSQGSGDSGGSFGGEIADSIRPEQLYWFSLLPNVGYTLCMKTYLGMDQTMSGCNWRNMFSPFKKYSVGAGLMMFLCDFLLYMVLYLYLEQVIQHDIGLARPWYFPLDPSFWREMFEKQSDTVLPPLQESSDQEDANDMKNASLFEEEDAEQLHELRRRQLVVSVRGLRKEFKNASGATIRAVDGLSLTMYQGECFCLLGHNGAGKSTTMAILTGMVPQDRGEVRVYGHTLPQERSAVRRQMGFCMQQNVLWETLTVEEHIQLFGALNGMSPEAVAASCDDVLKKVELISKKHAEASALSGGMKRKLNVALALLGNPRILFLDEPTAGMDPHTRRQLWEVLKQSRAERIVCLTTHYMDEADELGDRVAIMVSGRAACVGTNAFLKHKLGCGYVLSFVKEHEGVDNAPVEALVRRHCGDGVTESSVVGRELRLRVPFSGAAAFPSLMKELDSQLKILSMESYGVGVSDLEDVFLKVASGQDLTKGAPETWRKGTHIGAAETEGERPVPTAFRQFWGLFQRRVRYGMRDSRMCVCQLLLPLLVMVIFLAITRFAVQTNLVLDFPTVDLDTAQWSSPDGSGPALVSVGLEGDSGLGDAWLQTTPRGVTEVLVNSSLNLGLRPAVAGQGPLNPRKRALLTEMAFADYAYGVAHNAGTATPQFGAFLYTDSKVTVFPNTTAQYSAPALLNLHYSAVIAGNPATQAQAVPLERIEVASHPMKVTDAERTAVTAFSGVALGIIVLSAYSFIPAGIAAYVSMEKEVEVKHQLMVSGTGRVSYWLSNFAFDTLFGLFTSVGTLLVVWIYDANELLTYPNIKATIVLLVLIPPAVSLSSFFYSTFFNSSASSLVGLLIFGLVFGTFGIEVSDVLIIFPKTRYTGHLILWTMRLLLPSVCLGSGVMHLAMWKSLSEHVPLNPFSGLLFRSEYHFQWISVPVYLAGDDIFMLAVDIVLYTVLLLLMDGHGEYSFLRALFNFWPPGVKCPADQRQVEDKNVEDERLRIQGLDPSSQILLVDDVHKTYDGKIFAVRGISYAVEKGHVFGLLGVNGAGKTTTFKMLCGQLEPSAGRIFVGGKNVSKELEAVRKLIGYCPQFNALLDLLTVREHLELYGQIKGLSGAMLEDDIRDKMRTFDLLKFEHSRAGQLSGGNMRKLSCALAMVGEPPIVFLDEPSAGMDPMARRFMWDVIQHIAHNRKGSAVILTTHSMEEADALCSRIAIQASGQLRCLGTPQQLKEWYGTGLELNIRLETPARGAVEALCAQWDGRPQDVRPLAEVEALAVAHQAKQGAEPLPRGVAFSGGGSGTLGALAEWCLAEDWVNAVAAFLSEVCGEGRCSCVERTGRSLSFRLVGDCPGGGPRPYGELFDLLESNRERLHFADFQLSQGTLERTFNRLAAEDNLRHGNSDDH